jgi:hypothetical protein
LLLCCINKYNKGAFLLYTNRKNFRKKPKDIEPGLHAHHVIPLHAGGVNDASNIVYLTVTEHAEAHRILFEQYGKWQDKLAWQMLSGQIGKEEAIKFAQKNADKSWMKTPEGKALLKEAQRISWEKGNRPDPWNKGLTKDKDIRLVEYSERAKQHMSEGRIHCIGDSMRGKEFTDEHKEKLIQKALNRPKIKCEICGKEVIKQMYARWHGNNCKTVGTKSRRG